MYAIIFEFRGCSYDLKSDHTHAAGVIACALSKQFVDTKIAIKTAIWRGTHDECVQTIATYRNGECVFW